MSRCVTRFPQILYDRAGINVVVNPTTGGGGSSSGRRKLSRREWRRAAVAMRRYMDEAGIDPDPEIWQLFTDLALVCALGPMAGSVLLTARDEFAVAMGRMLRREKQT